MFIPFRKEAERPAQKASAAKAASTTLRAPIEYIAPTTGLRPYQLETVPWLQSHARGLLADEMGVGKTAPTLCAIPTRRAIIACPAALALNWKAECAGPLSTENGAPANGWRPDLTPRIIQKRGESIVPRKDELVIVPFGRMPEELSEDRLVKDDLSDVTFGIDEVHYAKNEKAKRTRQCRALARQVAWVWGLTGTPIPNRPGDLYGVLDTLGLIPETFESWDAYIKLFQGQLDSYGNWKFGRWMSGQRVVEDWRLERGAEIVKHVMLRRLKSEVMKDLPPKTYSERLVALSEKDVTVEIKKAAESWKLYGAEKLPPFSMLSEAMTQMALVKVPAMLGVVEEYEEAEKPLIVFSAHVEPVETLAHRSGWGGFHGGTPDKQRDRLVSDFQAGRLKGLALTIGAGGVGLTLTRGADALFVDRAHNPGDNVQAEDRLHRFGQKHPVNIIHLLTDHVIERWQMNLLRDKRRTTEAVVG